jgi:hypothetical protein
MLLVGVVNSAIAVSVSLWLSSVFYRGIQGSRRGGRVSAIRLVMLLAWGVAVLGIGVLFAATAYLIPLVQGALANQGAMTSTILSLVYPFALGVGVGATAHLLTSSGVEQLALAATVGYLLIAIVASRWSMTSIGSFSQGASLATGTGGTRDTSATVRGPVGAYVVKDLRMASVNLTSAFLFALPAFETLVILIYRGALPSLRASTLLVALVLGGLVALILPLVLVSSEGTGFDFAKTMPLRIRTIVYSKASIATAVFLPAVLVVFLESFLKPFSSPAVGLIPLASVLTVASASLLEVRLFLGFTPAGRVTFVLQDFARMAAGAGLVILPAVTYAVAYIFRFDQLLAAGAMLAVAALELIAVVEFVRRS